jgi:hypothetical protein
MDESKDSIIIPEFRLTRISPMVSKAAIKAFNAPIRWDA